MLLQTWCLFALPDGIIYFCRMQQLNVYLSIFGDDEDDDDGGIIDSKDNKQPYKSRLKIANE